MFIAHFENGESISEEQVGWDDLPRKEQITSLQLVHTPGDILYSIRRDLEKVLEVCSEDLVDRVRGTRQLLLNTSNLLAEAMKKKDELTEALRLDYVLEKWRSDVEKLRMELAEVRKLRGFEDEAARLDEQLRRLKYYIGVVNQIRRDRLLLRESDQRCVTLSGSREHRYFFFQFKEGEARLRVSGGATFGGTETQTVSQTIGMIVTPKGNCVCATMNLLNGWTRVYYTTAQSLRLSLEHYPYIDLKEVK